MRRESTILSISGRRDITIRTGAKVSGLVHRALYRLSGGRVGGNLGSISILLLTTKGRKTGKLRTQPLAYFHDGRDLVVVASYGGLDRNPAWYLNLVSSPRAVVQIGKRKVRVRAEEVPPQERPRVWDLVTSLNPVYKRYQTQTDRQIPLVWLHPRGQDGHR